MGAGEAGTAHQQGTKKGRMARTTATMKSSLPTAGQAADVGELARHGERLPKWPGRVAWEGQVEDGAREVPEAGGQQEGAAEEGIGQGSQAVVINL